MEFLIVRLDTDELFCGYGCSQLSTYDMQTTTEWGKYVNTKTKTIPTQQKAEVIRQQLLRFGFKDETLYIIAEQSS